MTVLMNDKENCPFARKRSHFSFFQSLPRFENVNAKSLIIDGCIGKPIFVIRHLYHHMNESTSQIVMHLLALFLLLLFVLKLMSFYPCIFSFIFGLEISDRKNMYMIRKSLIIATGISLTSSFCPY